MKEVTSPRGEILSPAESRASDALSSSEMSSSSTAYFVIPDVIEGS